MGWRGTLGRRLHSRSGTVCVEPRSGKAACTLPSQLVGIELGASLLTSKIIGCTDSAEPGADLADIGFSAADMQSVSPNSTRLSSASARLR